MTVVLAAAMRVCGPVCILQISSVTPKLAICLPFTGLLRRSGTYYVQMTTHYATCEPQLAETRFTVSPCPVQAQASYHLQDCDKVTEPGKRTLSLMLDAFAPDAKHPIPWQWQVLPAPSSSAVSSSISSGFAALLPGSVSFDTSVEFGVSTGSHTASWAGASAAPQAVATCQVSTSSAADDAASPSSCTLLVDSGPGNLRPGRSYVAMFRQQQQQQQNGAGLLWQELPALQVPKW
jgi:hypothetical protein